MKSGAEISTNEGTVDYQSFNQRASPAKKNEWFSLKPIKIYQYKI